MGQIFKLKNRGRAILSEEDYRTVILIPAKANVVLVGGDIDKDAFVKIRYGAKFSSWPPKTFVAAENC